MLRRSTNTQTVINGKEGVQLLIQQLHHTNTMYIYFRKSLFVYLIITLQLLIGCKQSTTSSEGSTTGKEAIKKYQLEKIKLPPGFTISVYAEVPNARSMCWGANGTLFVGNRDEDNVYAVVDENSDGTGDKVYTIARDLNMPNGVAFNNGSLYVAEVDRITRYDNIEASLSNPAAPVLVTDKYPDKSHHGWKFIAFGPDDKLYVPVGAPCNVCEEKDPIFASITRMNKDGSNLEIFAKGVRNSVGFAWHPDTKELWFTENGRDNMGDDVPFCEINHAPVKGLHFGFPYCHQGNILDPEFGVGKNCTDYVAPAKILAPHIAPLGMRFYTGNSFPAEYKNQIFFSEHGSWNRSKPIGFKISIAKLQDNKVIEYLPFATGWLQDDGKVLGRPVDVEIMKDGSLLVSDDYAGVIYKISYNP
jgi:glucose/arabinose dehydrogenase